MNESKVLNELIEKYYALGCTPIAERLEEVLYDIKYAKANDLL